MRTLAISLALLGCAPAEPVPAASDKSPEQPPPERQPEREPPTTEPPKPTTLPAQDGFFMAEGAPAPRGCTAASDCVGDTIPKLDQPCCQNPYTLEPYSWAYRNWLNGWRKTECVGVDCGPVPSPSQPPACAFDVDCVAGQCVDSCDD